MLPPARGTPAAPARRTSPLRDRCNSDSDSGQSSQGCVASLQLSAMRWHLRRLYRRGTCGRTERTVTGGCRIDASGTFRLVLREETNQSILRAIAAGGGLAVTFTKPSTHRSIQFKAGCAHALVLNTSDQQVVADQTTALKVDLVTDGFDQELAEQYCAFDAANLISIEFAPLQAYQQTPGPGAGAALTT